MAKPKLLVRCMPQDWLLARIDPMLFDSLGRQFQKYDWMPRWQKLLAMRDVGDEIWYFNSPDDTWKAKAGYCGFALVRRDVPIARVTTGFNAHGKNANPRAGTGVPAT